MFDLETGSGLMANFQPYIYTVSFDSRRNSNGGYEIMHYDFSGLCMNPGGRQVNSLPNSGGGYDFLF
jgi:hypothetical protein